MPRCTLTPTHRVTLDALPSHAGRSNISLSAPRETLRYASMIRAPRMDVKRHPCPFYTFVRRDSLALFELIRLFGQSWSDGSGILLGTLRSTVPRSRCPG